MIDNLDIDPAAAWEAAVERHRADLAAGLGEFSAESQTVSFGETLLEELAELPSIRAAEFGIAQLDAPALRAVVLHVLEAHRDRGRVIDWLNADPDRPDIDGEEWALGIDPEDSDA